MDSQATRPGRVSEIYKHMKTEGEPKEEHMDEGNTELKRIARFQSSMYIGKQGVQQTNLVRQEQVVCCLSTLMKTRGHPRDPSISPYWDSQDSQNSPAQLVLAQHVPLCEVYESI